MHTTWLSRVLGRLLPQAIARDLFEPASHDARFAYLTNVNAQSTAAPAPNERSGRSKSHQIRRTLAAIRYAAALLVIYADCWRLAFVLAVHWLWRHAQQLLSDTPKLPSTRKREHVAVIK